MKCSTCGKKTTPKELWVKFKCPACSDAIIVRCERCKKLVNQYKCEKCGFVGP
ncbi:MAG TPA: RNA-binding protein [Candidatus Aenigmarchaeota archaeon]|nr:MAG: RNA-binding protein [Candidatus Aenigmarchaeota archaeon]HDD45880.1 RNA-binding protein [Candidatus Aenigmarchaeota archaeon]